MNTYKTNQKLMDAVKKVVAKAGAQGDVEILHRTDERAWEISEMVKHGKSGCNYREEGDVDFRFIYDGYLTAVIIDEDLKTLSGNIAVKLEQECRALVDYLEQIRNQQEKDYWESQGYTY